ncbi:MAG TPA: pyruvate ferredoxin oxidoreductase [Prevotella sp.]|nr:pyruvate ferredoxin oxidoreductase [Prevotella sp.]
MDYKYINQLLDRYWKCETSLEEEDILRAFFSQDNVPADLKRYQSLFAYEAKEPVSDVLGKEFDEKMLSMVEEAEPVKAKVITMTQRLKPLFKAAAVVTIVLTLGNAMQVPFERRDSDPISNYDGYSKPELNHGTSVAMSDSAVIDTMKRSLAEPTATVENTVIK